MFTPAALPAMLKCAWPRVEIGSTVVVHEANFRPASTDLKPLPIEKMVKAYRASALDGIAYAWDKAMGRRHREIRAIEAPASWRPFTPPAKAPRPEPPKDSPLVSANGKRLPLAAFSYEELNRRFWSKGRTLYQTERNRPLELQAYDKQPEEMSIEELEATQERDPLSESRRSWLELGIKTLALNGYSDEDDDDGDVENFAYNMDDLDMAEHDDARYAHAFGTAMVEVDPITQKQIDWEKRVHNDGHLRSFKLIDGNVRLVPPKKGARVLPFESNDEFIRAAKKVLPLLLDQHAPKPALSAERITDLCKKFDRYVSNFVEQQNEFAHREWHGHYLDSAGMLHFHGTNVLSLEEEKYGPYHAVPQDRAELAIYNSTGSDEEIEEMLGTSPCLTCDDGLVPKAQPYAFFADPYFPDAPGDPRCNECGIEQLPALRVYAKAI